MLLRCDGRQFTRAAACEADADDSLVNINAALFQEFLVTAMRSKRCCSFSCNIAAMVVAGAGAEGKRVLCSSGAAFEERKFMAMRHGVCKYWAFLFVHSVTFVNLHGVPGLNRCWSCPRLFTRPCVARKTKAILVCVE